MNCTVCEATCIVIRNGSEVCNQCGAVQSFRRQIRHFEQIDKVQRPEVRVHQREVRLKGEPITAPINVEEYQHIPIYIINRNNLDRGFRDLVNWLINAGSQNIEVLDNESSYRPLLEYYESCPVKITKLGENRGPWWFWDNKMHLQTMTPYIVTDSDVVPDKDCPHDLVRKMLEVFVRYKNDGCMKVGPGLRTDNLPDYYSAKQEVIEREHGNSSRLMPEGDVFRASIDTTFALYWTKQNNSLPSGPHDQHYRLAQPYVVEHRPWYIDKDCLTEEDHYYKATCGKWSNWARG